MRGSMKMVLLWGVKQCIRCKIDLVKDMRQTLTSRLQVLDHENGHCNNKTSPNWLQIYFGHILVSCPPGIT